MNPTVTTLKKVVFLLAAVLFIGQIQAAPQTASQVMAQVKARYKNVKTLTAAFKQTVHSDYAGGTRTISGTISMRGSAYRVETGDQTIVSDGKLSWVYTPSDRQVLLNRADDGEAAYNLNDFLYSNRFSPVSVKPITSEGVTYQLLQVKPRNRDDQFRQATLWVRASDHLVTRIDVVDGNDDSMSFALSSIKINPTLSDQMFTFKAPKGIEVVDLR